MVVMDETVNGVYTGRKKFKPPPEDPIDLAKAWERGGRQMTPGAQKANKIQKI